MSEHRIRLRGAWECTDMHAESDVPARLTLPAPISAILGRRLKLARRFGRPPADALGPGVTVLLLLESVPGLVVVSLNGEEVGMDALTRTSVTIRLPRLDARNLLELMVDFEIVRESRGEERTHEDCPESWGDVALIFRSGA